MKEVKEGEHPEAVMLPDTIFLHENICIFLLVELSKFYKPQNTRNIKYTLLFYLYEALSVVSYCSISFAK